VRAAPIMPRTGAGSTASFQDPPLAGHSLLDCKRVSSLPAATGKEIGRAANPRRSCHCPLPNHSCRRCV
jgi:hypothetical protein